MNKRFASLAAILLLAGCGGAASGEPPGSGPTTPAGHPGSLVVTSRYVAHTPDGGVLIEGAMAEVLLYDAQGHLVAKRTAQPGHTVAFRGLAPGTYTVAPALRPCDGNCGYLDARLKPCQADVQVQGRTTVQVRYQQAVTCRISS